MESAYEFYKGIGVSDRPPLLSIILFALAVIVSGSVTFGTDCSVLTSQAEDWSPPEPTTQCWDAFLSYRRCDVCKEASFIHKRLILQGITSFLYQHHR
jgi:hypothetical protein